VLHLPLVVVNPASRGGATGRRWAQLEARLRDALGELDVQHTRGPRDAERVAREAARAGVERILVAGGDGTTSEVVSGLLAADLGDQVALGLLPLGTGGDLARTLALPRDLDGAVEAIRRGRTRRIDAGRIRYRGRDGRPSTAYFLNVASFGISGLVDDLVTRTPRLFGGSVAFAIATLRAILRYRFTELRLRLDGEEIHHGPCVMGVAANGRYFGGGMQIAPNARPDDGALDVVTVGAHTKLQLVTRFPSLYRGRHLEEPGVSSHRGKQLEADAEPGRVWLDVDGEPLGTLPASIEVLPGAVTLLGADGERREDRG